MSHYYRELQGEINEALEEDNPVKLSDLLSTVHREFSKGLLSALEWEHLVFLIRA